MKLATTIGEVYAFTASPAEAVSMYKDTGFKYLDYSFYSVIRDGSPYMDESDLRWKREVEDAGKMAESLGFTFVQAHTPSYNPEGRCDHERSLRAVVRSMEACGMLGIRNAVIHTAFSAKYPYPEKMDEYCKASRVFLEKFLPYSERFNVTLCVENSCTINTGGNCFFMTGAEARSFVEDMNHPYLGVCWDVGHAAMQGCDMYKELVTLGKHLKTVHIHDNNGRSDEHLAPYCGIIDYNAIVKALLDIEFGGYFCFEADSFYKAKPGLACPSKEVKRLALKLLYETGKDLLEKHGCFEA